MDKPIFKLNNIQFKQGNETLLNIKNFEFHRGTCYMLCGEMGSGKTLALNILAKNLKAHNGDVYYEDSKLHNLSMSAYLKDVAYVTQESRRPFFKNVYQYIYSHVNNMNQTDKVDKLVNNIPHGSFLSIKEVRQKLADNYKAEMTCPVVTGINMRIISEN